MNVSLGGRLEAVGLEGCKGDRTEASRVGRGE